MNKHFKKLLIATAFLVPVLTMAQNAGTSIKEELIKENFVHILSLLLTLSFWAVAIIYFVKMILDDRIKNKLIDKGAPDTIVAQLLQPAIKDSKNNIIKWVFLLASAGVGLLLVDYFQPLGIHSIAIVMLSLSAGFLAYFFFVKKAEQK